MGKIKSWKLKSKTKYGERFYQSTISKQQVDVFKKGKAYAPYQWRVAISKKSGYFSRHTPSKRFKSGEAARKYAIRYMKQH